jgi:putative pyruvate formate lyase activating enzyme
VGDLRIEDGLALRGLLVRHLVMPGHLDETREILKFLADEISAHTFVNVMDQYRPCYRAREFASINRGITPAEFAEALESGRQAGLSRIYC